MKILYGVPGEGMGHATRSKEVILFLLSLNHDVHVVSSHKAFHFLDKTFPGRVTEIKGFHFGFEDGKISKWQTFLFNLRSGPKNLLFNFSKFLKLEKQFEPDLVISDFESFTWAYSKLHRLPLICIDNIQVIDRCRLEIKIPKEEKNNFKLAKNIVRTKVPGADKYFITSFFDCAATKRNTVIVPPIIRKAIQEEEKPTFGDHILVYQSAGSAGRLKNTFRKFEGEHFKVYGSNKNETSGNIEFKTFSEEGFINDFAGCKAVIANGGFSFLSEAVYLRKPVYSFPLPGQFEQFLNAAYIEKCGYGKRAKDLNAEDLWDFLENLNTYRKNLSKYKQNGNEVLFELLERELEKLFRVKNTLGT